MNNEPPKRILIVDDEAGMRETLCDILEEFDFDVTSVESGEKAVAYVRDHRCDCDIVLMDIRMPGISGIEALKLIHADEPALLVVLMSANADALATAEASKGGAAAILAKPLDIDNLLHVVDDLLHSRETITKT